MGSYVQSFGVDNNSNNTSRTQVVTATAGNALVCILTFRVNDPGTVVMPGYTLRGSNTGTGSRTYIYTRTATGTSADDANPSWDNSAQNQLGIDEYTDVDNIDAFEAIAGDEGTNVTSPFSTTDATAVTASGIAHVSWTQQNWGTGGENVAFVLSTFQQELVGTNASRPHLITGSFPYVTAGAKSDEATFTSTAQAATMSIVLLKDAAAGTPLVFDGNIADITGVEGVPITPVDVSGEWSGGVPPYTFNEGAGTPWPAWATIDILLGIISGIPTAAGTTSGHTANAKDNDGGSEDSNAFQFIISGAAQNIPVGRADETDSARVITPLLHPEADIGLAEEADQAFPITPVVGAGVLIGLAEETDEALTITPLLGTAAVIGLSEETNEALPILPLVSPIVAIGVAEETDEALRIAPQIVGEIRLPEVVLTPIDDSDTATITAIQSGPTAVETGIDGSDTVLICPIGTDPSAIESEIT